MKCIFDNKFVNKIICKNKASIRKVWRNKIIKKKINNVEIIKLNKIVFNVNIEKVKYFNFKEYYNKFIRLKSYD